MLSTKSYSLTEHFSKLKLNPLLKPKETIKSFFYKKQPNSPFYPKNFSQPPIKNYSSFLIFYPSQKIF